MPKVNLSGMTVDASKHFIDLRLQGMDVVCFIA